MTVVPYNNRKRSVMAFVCCSWRKCVCSHALPKTVSIVTTASLLNQGKQLLFNCQFLVHGLLPPLKGT